MAAGNVAEMEVGTDSLRCEPMSSRPVRRGGLDLGRWDQPVGDVGAGAENSEGGTPKRWRKRRLK